MRLILIPGTTPMPNVKRVHHRMREEKTGKEKKRKESEKINTYMYVDITIYTRNRF